MTDENHIDKMLDLVSPNYDGLSVMQRAKNDLMQGWDTPAGAICACCGQKVKRHKRRVYSVPAAELVRLYRLNRDDRESFHHISAFAHPIPVISKMVYWGLVESRINTDSKKRTSGYWRITDKGVSFVKGELTIPSFVYVYNNRVDEISGEHVSIIDCLDESFNYADVMGLLI